MNSEQIQAIEERISYLEDNLYRYRKQQQAAGMDSVISRTISEHESKIAELKEGL